MTNVPEPVINRPAETAPEEVRRAKCNARGEIKRTVAPSHVHNSVGIPLLQIKYRSCIKCNNRSIRDV